MSRPWFAVLVLFLAPFSMANAAPYGLEPGKYHALIIANQNYKELPSLKTPHADAEALAQVLRRDYGFKITVLSDVDRAATLDALDLQVERLGERDNLLIFYAGHGHLDSATGEGYWLPVSANPRRRSEWISNKTINDTLRAVRARHVMVISDSCFSGTLTRNVRAGLNVAGDRSAYYHKLVRQRSRTALTSGGLEPVDDGGGGGHSVFAGALLSMLENNREPVLEGEQLYQMIRRPVALNSSAQQQPAYADVRQTGHEGGDFLFIHSNPRHTANAAPVPPVQATGRPEAPAGQQAAFELSFWQTIKDSDDPRDFEAYLQAYPEGQFAALARLRANESGASAPAAISREPEQQQAAVRVDPVPARPLPLARPAVSGEAVVLLAYAVPHSEYSPDFSSVAAYSKAVAELMQSQLGMDDARLVTDKNTTRGQILEGRDHEQSRALCIKHGARILISAELDLTRDIEEMTRSPDTVYYSVYDCSSDTKRFKGYPVDFNNSDRFTYESALRTALQRFEAAYQPLAQ